MKSGLVAMQSKARNMRQRTERNEEIVRAVLQGETLKSAGERHGITRERVRQIVYFYCRRANKEALARMGGLQAMRDQAQEFLVR